EDQEQRANIGFWEQDEKRAGHGRDRTGRTEYGRREITHHSLLAAGEHVDARRGDSSDQVERQEADPPEPIFDRWSEHKQEQHVAQQMEEVSVQELVTEQLPEMERMPDQFPARGPKQQQSFATAAVAVRKELVVQRDIESQQQELGERDDHARRDQPVGDDRRSL